MIEKVFLHSPEQTVSFGTEFVSRLKKGDILALQGALGAGKTTFVQGLLEGLGIKDLAQSPTFTYLQIYQGQTPVYHFDLYRLPSEKEFIFLGFEEFLYADGICVIEWPDRISSLLSEQAHQIHFTHSDKGREAVISFWKNYEV